MSERWQFWIDVGGTFTDCLAIDPANQVHRLKILSSARIRTAVTWNAERLDPVGDPPTQQANLSRSTAANSDPPAAAPLGKISAQVRFQFPTSPGLLSGYRCQCLDADGRVIFESVVADHHTRSVSAADQQTATDTFPRDRDRSLIAAPDRLTFAAPNDPKALQSLLRYGVAIEIHSEQVAPVLAMRLALQLPLTQTLPPVVLRLGTTRGTNALLTRSGAKTALITTAGFADALEIGNQQRPDLFAIQIKKTPQLYSQVAQIDQRIASDGSILREIDPEQVRQVLSDLQDQGVQSLAVALLNAYQNPAHELLIGALAADFDFANVSLSHQVSPLIKWVPRASTTVLDAYLNPVLAGYLAQIHAAIGPASEMLLMTSSGGLVPRSQFSGKDSLLSGPAGGACGFAAAARQAGFARAIGFDMGGTSTDVSRLDGQLSLHLETIKAGIAVQTPTLAIETVAAGGGSICRFDGQRLLVGPESAGADPGPACYGRGGPLTVTDLNVWLGRVPVGRFPIPLQLPAVQQRLETLAQSISLAISKNYSLDELALAFLEIANSHMALAIASITTRQGVDPSDYVLVAFGGAAGQHACGVADQLGMSKILLHPDAGLLSAVGMGHSVIRRIEQASWLQPLSEKSLPALNPTLCSLRTAALNKLPLADQASAGTTVRLRLALQGNEQTLVVVPEVEFWPNERGLTWGSTVGSIAEEFWNQYEQQFGFRQQKAIEIVSVEVEVAAQPSRSWAPETETPDHWPAFATPSPEQQRPEQPWPTRICDLADCGFLPATVRDRLSIDPPTALPNSDACWQGRRDRLPQGQSFFGPLVIMENHSTLFVAKHWQGQVLADGQILLQRVAPKDSVFETEPLSEAGKIPAKVLVKTACDPLRLELFHHRLTEVATQMGLALQATCTSVNVKERLDFSCAVFDRLGNLVVNAPHIPVHLGAMSETVKSIIARNPDVAPGDVFVTNDPFQGGSHLPDVTVVSPLFADVDREPFAVEIQEPAAPRFWVASRAHHAEIGGITPGSMPPFSQNLEQEGVVIRNFRLLQQGHERFAEFEHLLRGGKYPTRNPAENLADLRAQVAANRLGQRLLQKLLLDWGPSQVGAYTDFIQVAAAELTSAAIRKFTPGEYRFVDSLDCGLTLRLLITVDHDRMIFDFAGTDPPQGNNFNTNPAIVSSAVVYCLRLLIDAPIPLNQGVLRQVQIRLPNCFLNPVGHVPAAEIEHWPAADLPAVVGGNVETSQRLVDVILGALNVCAASQGTMNNFLFGDQSFGFYETIGGGSGASRQGPGASAVHCHMTNTRLTDPEILEKRYPVRLLEFAIRRASGGVGKHRGGDGMIRRFEFLRPLTVSLLTNRRDRKEETKNTSANMPWGIDGGGPGALGENRWFPVNGEVILLPASCEVQVWPNDQIEIRTPGGGAWSS